MTYRNIYETALTLLGETPGSPGVEDFESRSAYILPSVVGALNFLSPHLGGDTCDPTATVNLDSDFPLADQLVFPASARLAARLIFDQSSEQSSALDRFADTSIELIVRSLTDVGSTREVYE